MILSEKGWIKAVRGHQIDPSAQKFKEGDGLRADLGVIACTSADRLCLFASDGRAFTLKAGDLPRGRGDGQPIRLMIELANEVRIIALFRLPESGRFLIAGSNGRGLAIEAADLASEKRTGRQVLNLKPGERTVACVPAQGDRVAVLGDNRRLLVFPLEQVAVLARGTGTTLQKYREGGLRAVRVFDAATGLVWQDGAKPRSMADLLAYVGARGDQGRPAPRWLPQD